MQNKIPPPIVLVVFLVLMRMVALWDPIRLADSGFILAVSLLTLIMGCLLALSGVLDFARARTTIDPLHPDKATQLVTGGVFRFTRNPMYLGMALVCVSAAIYWHSPLALLGVVGFVAYIQYFQIHPEEQAMQRLFGQQFTDYQQRTRRWL